MPKRIPFEENAYYHIYNRGLNHQTLFFSDKDFDRFLWNLEQLIQKYQEDIKLIAYCILPNHFHLVIQNLREGFALSKAIGELSVNYIRWYKAKYQITEKGKTFFEARFQAKKIDTEEYLNTCIYYVEHNALKHQLVEDMKQRPFSSYTPDVAVGDTKEILTLDWEF